jgi:enamine deaminase RidA (YjgF/YER057c/UK114 family)
VDEITRLGGEPPSPYETQYGFSRTVAVGQLVLGETPYEQAVVVLGKLLAELTRLGCGVEQAVQLRAYVTDISRADEVGRAFAEVFGVAKPLFTMVEVSALIDPRMQVEIELVAYRG